VFILLWRILNVDRMGRSLRWLVRISYRRPGLTVAVSLVFAVRIADAVFRPGPALPLRVASSPAPVNVAVADSSRSRAAYDLIPAAAPIRRLYESDDLTAFIAAVLGKRVLYRSADPLDALEIAVFGDGDELGWHFDNSEFSVTVMYSESEAGGHFDYYPWLRGEHDENYPGVQKVLLGDQGGVISLPGSPGTLAVFRGQHALHRVTPVSGPRPRINSVLTYGERPGMKLNRLTQELFYGRTA